jgi:uncharacterized membrane protein YbhN (UPF0104 family)
MASQQSTYWQPRLKLLFYLLCLVFLVLVVIREHGVLAQSLHAIGRVSPWWLVAGFCALLLSVFASAGVYGALSPRRLRFWRTAAVQTGGLGINRLLPAGSGALGVSYLYLRANKVNKAESAALVATNNSLGFVGHALLLGLAITLSPEVFGQFEGISAGKYWPWFGIAGGVFVALVLFVLLARSRGGGMLRTIRPVFSRPARLGWALGFSMLITLCYVSAVCLAAAALGYQLSLAAGLVILSFGVAAASVVPVPGGIGAAEAGIFAGMHAYGASTQDGLAVALLYRVMTFWLPLLVGGLVFIIVERRGYLQAD